MQIIIGIGFTLNYFIMRLKVIKIDIVILIPIIIAYSSKAKIARVTLLYLIKL